MNHCLAFLVLALPFSAAAENWPHWLGPNQNGITDEEIEPEFGGVVWRAEVGTGFSSMSVVDGRVYTMGNSGSTETVWCLDAETGNPLWKHSYRAQLLPNLHEGGPAATPTVNRDSVYTLGKDGKAFRLNAETGQVIWAADLMTLARMSKPPEWGFSSSPLIHGFEVIFEAGQTMALSQETGQVVWQGRNYTPAYGSTAKMQIGFTNYLASIKTEGLVVMNEKGETLAMTPWQTSFNTNASTPLIEGDKIFVSTGYARGCALFQFDPENRRLKKIYENKAMSNHMNASVLIDGHLYGFSGTAHRGPKTQFACIEFATGRGKWLESGLGCGSVIAAGGGKYLIILSERGEMVIAKPSPTGFEALTREQLLGGRCWTPPVLANGRLYARNSDGELVCVAVGQVAN
ncbi:MAG: outer membrane protein assembly factor BamB [Verrucomicrobiales bacterium]|jgi:outer membrane protein assembly factor BamB